jgi:hypothetical protein
MKRILLLALVALFAASAHAETRDINPVLEGMFNYGAPFEDTVAPTAPATSIPQFIGQGATAATTTSGAPGMFTGAEAGDLAIILVEYANDVEPTMTGSWADLPVCGPTGTGTGCPDGDACTAVKAFYQVIDQSSPARTVNSNAGDHVYYTMIGFSGGSFNAADPFEDNCSTIDLSTPTTALTIPAFVTENDNSMVITVWANGNDLNNAGWGSASLNTTATNPFTTEVPGAALQSSQTKSTGDGGGLIFQFSVVPVAGSTGVASATSAVTKQFAGMSFGINGVTP